MWSAETIRVVAQLPQNGIFLTGIEGSDPVVDGVRRNQLKEAHDFYLHYKERLANIRDLGLTWLRFGPPYSQIHLGKDDYDWQFMDAVVAESDRLGITLIADLLHFGLPEWLHESATETPYFQNPAFPIAFGRYAAAFARRYPSIRYYTPVNEPFITCYLSAKLGWWNEAKGSAWSSDHDFVRAANHLAKAAILAKKAIRQVWLEEERAGEPLFIQNESFELAEAKPGAEREAEARRFNLRRFVLLDLIFGHRDSVMMNYLAEYGLTSAEYEWFIEHGETKGTILGIDYYPTCIHVLEADRVVSRDDAERSHHLFDLVREYWERYPLPLLHTEVNSWPDHALKLCQETYDALARLRHEGYPVLGMGWYGDELQIGWHVAMVGPDSQAENPVGLFHYGSKQPVAELYGQLAVTGLPAFDHQQASLRMTGL